MDRQIQRTLGGEFETHDCPHNLNFPSVTNHVGVMGSQCPARQSMWQRGERSDGWRSWGVITIPVGQCVNVRVKDTCEDIVCMLGEWRLSSAHRGLGRAGFLFVGNISNHGKDKSPGGVSLPRGKRTTGNVVKERSAGTGENLICKQTISLLPLLSALRATWARQSHTEGTNVPGCS